MTINLDKSYCASTDCVGACGRQVPNNVPHELLHRMWFGCFCGDKIKEDDKEKKHFTQSVNMV